MAEHLTFNQGVVSSILTRPISPTRQSPALPPIVDKATGYVTAYVKALTSIVSEERHELEAQEVVGRSTYSNFRRFRVDSSFDVK